MDKKLSKVCFLTPSNSIGLSSSESSGMNSAAKTEEWRRNIWRYKQYNVSSTCAFSCKSTYQQCKDQV